jgi:hypothetical protein
VQCREGTSDIIIIVSNKMGCIFSVQKTETVKIKQKRKIRTKFSFFQRTKTVEVGVQTNWDSVSTRSSYSEARPTELEGNTSIGRPETVVSFRTYSDLSVSDMINILEETRARKTTSNTTYTVKMDDGFSTSSSPHLFHWRTF